MTRSLVATAATAVLLTAAPPAASAADPVTRGATTLTVSSTAAKQLRRAGVKLTAARPATFRRSTLTLPIQRGVLTGARYVEHGGSLTFTRRAGGRSRKVVLRALRTSLTARPAITASVGGRRMTVLQLAPRAPRLNAGAGTAVVQATSATLTRAAATRLRRTLGVRVARALGRVAVEATLRGESPVQAEAPVVPPAPAPAPAPAPEARTTVRDVAITWHVRDSLIRYLASSIVAESDGTIVSDGATEGAPTVRPGSSEALVYDFAFAPSASASWLSGDTAGLFGEGTLRFSYPEHGNLDLRFSAPEVRLAGAASRVVFRLDGGSVADASRGQRAELLALDPTVVTPASAPVDGGTRVTYERIPAKVTDAAATAMNGYYAAGEDFGAVTLSYTR